MSEKIASPPRSSRFAAWFDGAWFSNKAKSVLPSGVLPFPKCHASPPERTWQSFDGTSLPYSVALPQTAPKAVVLIVPGTDSVTGDYASVTDALVARGCAVYGCENRSFAYGPGTDLQKGNPRSWQPWIRDLQGFSRFVRTQHPGLPMIWHGQSFGGVHVLQTAAETTGADAPDGLIIHSPAFGMMFRKATLLRGLRFGIIAWLRVPWCRLIETANMPMTDDPVVDSRWKHSEDRLPYGFKVRFFIHAANMAIAARNSSAQLKMPVLALWGGKDRMGLGGNEKLRTEYYHYMRHELAGGRATQFHRPDGIHLLTEGSTKRDALEAIIRWLDALVP